jgi:hypothetical protein
MLNKLQEQLKKLAEPEERPAKKVLSSPKLPPRPRC